MQNFALFLLFISIFSLILSVFLLVKGYSSNSTVSSLYMISAAIFVFLSFFSFGIVMIIPYNTTEQPWSQTINIDSQRVEINKERPYIEITTDKHALIERNVYYYRDEVKDNRSENEPIIIVATKVAETNIFNDKLFDGLVDVSIENANE